MHAFFVELSNPAPDTIRLHAAQTYRWATWSESTAPCIIRQDHRKLIDANLQITI
jgi:hypothetical protein